MSQINKRDYIVMASGGLTGARNPGESFWVNYFLVVGTKEDVIKNAKKYANKPNYGALDFSEETATLSPLYADDKLMLTREKLGNAKPVCHVYNQPIKDSQPLFRIEEVPSGKMVITVDPYELSHKADWPNVLPKDHARYEEFNNRKTILPHFSQDKKSLKWVLLGFVIPDRHTKLEASKYVPISEIVSVPDHSGNMLVRGLK